MQWWRINMAPTLFTYSDFIKFEETVLDTAWHTTDVETAGYLNDGLAEVEPYCNTGTYFNKYISYFCLLYTC